MKREELTAMGLTDEQIEKSLLRIARMFRQQTQKQTKTVKS